MTTLKNLFVNNKLKNIHKWLHYFDIYEENFHKFRNKKNIFLEIGVFKGGSLKMWSDYFGKETKIYGIDIDPNCKKYENDQIKIFIGDQTDEFFLKNVINEIGSPNIILDDGGHTNNQQITSFNYLFKRLQHEGVYMVEDTHTSYHNNFKDRKDGLTFSNYAKILSDELNDWYRINDYKAYKQKIENVEVSFWAKNIYKIIFYNSIIYFEKKISEVPRCEMK